jgi:hypothetical protein
MIYYCCLVYLGLFLIYIKYLKISARGILATITASAGQNEKFSKVGTVFVYLLSNFRFDNSYMKDFYPKNMVVRKIFRFAQLMQRLLPISLLLISA